MVTEDKKTMEIFAAAVRGLFDGYSACIESGDIDGWIALWDEGGIQLPPGSPMREDLATIKKAVGKDLQTYQYSDFDIEISGTYVDRAIGFACGNYSFLRVEKGSGERLSFNGKYETIFKKQVDGTWKIFRDCFNSNS